MGPPQSMEQRNIAIVMTDIIGSTAFVQRHGAEKAALWFSKHDRLMMTLVAEFDGVWVDASDGVLVFFYSVGDAIAFSFEYKKKIKRYKFPFRSRLGIHWANMIITKTSKKLVSGGAKRLNIEGIGKNVCARTMSLCGPEQILLSQAAYLTFKSRGYHKYIPKDVLSVLVGLYKFKGVSEPEQIYALGTEQSHLQPPEDSEKAKRIGGKGKIKTRLRQKKLKEIVEYVFWRVGFVCFLYVLWGSWPFLRYYDTIDDIHNFFVRISDGISYLFHLFVKHRM
jgi:class 3 adenylate cyclase